ncbi:MAG: bifunctional adenosylcobinamide kinase/adenosylcobinamide-phosphate guanylyltransferase [Planctomycetes bacterium]|nr:bifunctional adenosylcobinamide kinase/adenosylcobinamide-phosphate guanylyltransferase [Planctomycetota bacterium]
MILIIGGKGAGKGDYVRNRFGLADHDIADAVLDGKQVVDNLHHLLRDGAVDADAVIAACKNKRIVICDEVGCGIVPLDPAEREWRDRVGRACAALAADAEQVVRLVCGLPQIIKGGDE